MANLADLVPLLASGAPLRRATVAEIREDGLVRVVLAAQEPKPGAPMLDCEVLHPDGHGSGLAAGDAVLVWPGDAPGLAGEHGIVLGRVGPHAGPLPALQAPQPGVARRASLVIEAEGELVLRNGQARIRIGPDGDVEIACNSFATRSRRLLRLLAPMIKLN